MPYVNPNRSFSSSSSSDAFAPAVHPLPSNAGESSASASRRGGANAMVGRRVESHRPVLANGRLGRRLPWPAPDNTPWELPVTPQPVLVLQPSLPDERHEGRHNGRLSYAIRTQIKTLKRMAGWTLHRIADFLSQPYTTVHGIATEAATPAGVRGQFHGLRQFGTPVANRIIEYVTSGAEGRRATYKQIRERLDLACSIDTIRRRLNERGYFKRVARRAPFLDADGLDLRPQFGQWCIDQLNRGRTFQFGDAAAFGQGGQQKFLVIRRADEAFDPDCLGPKYKRMKTQLVYGFVSGNKKSRLIFWDNSWGKMNAKSLKDYVIPELHRFWRECGDAEAALRLQEQFDTGGFDGFVDESTFSIDGRFGSPTPVVEDAIVDDAVNGDVDIPASVTNDAMPLLMLDGASVHKAATFRGELDRLGIPHGLDIWPANSPDLNPIENVWAMMKYRLNRFYDLPSSPEVLREQIQEVWDALTEHDIGRITGSFRARCEKVIARDGRHTGY